jgi:cell division protein FtsQ
LQQVGAKGFINAQPVDLRVLPVPVPLPRRGLAVRANHAWVLHRQRIVKLSFAALLLAAGMGVFAIRDVLVTVAGTGLRFVQGEFAQAGFGINGIHITGQRLTSDADIIALLTVGMGDSTVTFDAQKAQARLKWLRAVKSATVKKVYPNEVFVDIVEKEPVVRWRVGSTTWLLDERGERIGTDVSSFTNLPLVIGEGASDDGVAMARLMDRHPKLQDGLAALSRIGDRRWDLIYRNGLRVQLPETGVAQALDRIEQYQASYQLMDRDVTVIDLRVAGLVTLVPGEQAKEQLAKTLEAPHKVKGSSEYETASEQKSDGTTGTH